MSDTVQAAENPGTVERRLHPRKQLLFPWIKWGVDNGGIILNISESGLAMQAVRSLADGELPAMRFQLSESQNWIETPGRIAWINASKHTAGVKFVGLSVEARNKIKQWIPLTLHPNGSAEGNPPGEQIEPAKNTRPAFRFSYEGTTLFRDRELTSSPRNSRRWIGVLVVVSFLVLVLLLLTLFFPGIFLRHAGNSQQSREVPAAGS